VGGNFRTKKGGGRSNFFLERKGTSVSIPLFKKRKRGKKNYLCDRGKREEEAAVCHL